MEDGSEGGESEMGFLLLRGGEVCVTDTLNILLERVSMMNMKLPMNPQQSMHT